MVEKMVEIPILGGDTEAAADELATALPDIFAVEPVRTIAGGGHAPGTRGLAEAALIILTLPPAIRYTKDILSRAQFGQRLQRLTANVPSLRETSVAYGATREFAVGGIPTRGRQRLGRAIVALPSAGSSRAPAVRASARCCHSFLRLVDGR